MRLIIGAGVFTLLLSGCLGYVKPTEPDRQLNHQNIGAGAAIEAAAVDPSIKQAGADVKANSLTLEKSLMLKPETPLPYSTKVSAEKRKESEESHSGTFWTIVGGAALTLLGWLGRGGALRLLSVVAPTFAAGPLGTAAVTLVEGVARARLKAQNSESKSISDKDLTLILGGLQDDAGVQVLVDKLRAKIEPRVKGLL